MDKLDERERVVELEGGGWGGAAEVGGGCVEEGREGVESISSHSPAAPSWGRPRAVGGSGTASLVPCMSKHADTSQGPWPWGPCSGPCTRSSWGPRSSCLDYIN